MTQTVMVECLAYGSQPVNLKVKFADDNTVNTVQILSFFWEGVTQKLQK